MDDSLGARHREQLPAMEIAAAVGDSGRTHRIAQGGFLVGAGALVVLIIAQMKVLLMDDALFGPMTGLDYRLYRAAAHRWIEGGDFYLSYQLAGPYTVTTDQILYPPMSLPLLFVPSLVLPPLLWWTIPLVTIAAVMIHWHPSPWAWLLIGWCLAQSQSVAIVAMGNPAMWVAAALAVATIWRPAAAFVFLKPSLALFALFGGRDRRWWLAVAALAAVSLVMLPMDMDWLRAIFNARGERSGLLYSLRDVPFIAVPLVAWIGSSHRSNLEGRKVPRNVDI